MLGPLALDERLRPCAILKCVRLHIEIAAFLSEKTGREITNEQVQGLLYHHVNGSCEDRHREKRARVRQERESPTPLTEKQQTQVDTHASLIKLDDIKDFNRATKGKLDPAVIETSGGRRFVFGIHLRKFGASAYRSGEDSFEDISIDHPDQDRTRSET